MAASATKCLPVTSIDGEDKADLLSSLQSTAEARTYIACLAPLRRPIRRPAPAATVPRPPRRSPRQVCRPLKAPPRIPSLSSATWPPPRLAPPRHRAFSTAPRSATSSSFEPSLTIFPSKSPHDPAPCYSVKMSSNTRNYDFLVWNPPRTLIRGPREAPSSPAQPPLSQSET